MLNVTHTFAQLPVSLQTYREIADKLRAARYMHVFLEEGIDMNGIGIVPEVEENTKPEGNTDVFKLQVAVTALKEIAGAGVSPAFPVARELRDKAQWALEAMERPVGCTGACSEG